MYNDIMIKAIIFDCFGVLYPNASAHFFQRHSSLFNNDTTYLDKLNLQIDLGQITRAKFFSSLAENIGISAEQIQREIDQELIVDQKLIEIIKGLRNYKIGLLSNAGKEEIDIIYRDKIDSLFTSKTISYETGFVKPSKEIFEVCLQRLEIKPEESLFIDDSVINISAAQTFGMNTVLYNDVKEFSSELEKFKLPVNGIKN